MDYRFYKRTFIIGTLVWVLFIRDTKNLALQSVGPITGADFDKVY